MFEKFGLYSEVRWTALAAARSIGINDKIPTTPDLDNFKLARFNDYRKLPKVGKEAKPKLMLIGDNNTNIIIDGPDLLIDEIAKRLPKRIGKSWQEISSMRLERDFSNCNNYETSVCSPELLNILMFEPVISGEEVPELDLNKADEICAKCEHFEPK